MIYSSLIYICLDLFNFKETYNFKHSRFLVLSLLRSMWHFLNFLLDRHEQRERI